MIIGEKFSLCDLDVWQIQRLTEPCKSCVLSCPIWMSLQHIQVEGLSVRRAFKADWYGGLSWHWLRHWQIHKKPFVGMTCQMDKESVFVYWVQFSFKLTYRPAAVFSEANNRMIF